MQWNGEYFLVGVRRDTTDNGQGRMEYSRVEIDKANWSVKETHRKRIPAPLANDSYCEKNWFPILDKPYTFVKWTCPTEVVYNNPFNDEPTMQVGVYACEMPTADQRGSSQMLRWGNIYIAITHEVSLFKNYLGQKDAVYRHRLLLWTDEWEFIGASNPFAFLDFPIEFCVGAAVFNNDLLLSFGFQDNVAFVLQTPGELIDQLIEEALSYENR